MNIIFLKTGRLAIHPARGPFVACKAGKSADLTEHYAERFIEAGWAKVAEEVVDVVAPVVIPSPPWLAPWWDPKADDAKDKLETFGIEVHGVDIDRRKSVKNIIKVLEELGEE